MNENYNPPKPSDNNWLRFRILLLVIIGLITCSYFLSYHAAQRAAAAQAVPIQDTYVEQDTIVRCDPATATGFFPGTVSVEIYIEDVVELYGADVRMSFDTSMVQVIDAEPNSPNSVQIELLEDFLSPDFVLRKNADNNAGTIWYAATQVNPTEPVSGSGPLARVSFETLQPGTFTMPVTQFELARRDGTIIDAVSQDCTLTIIELKDDQIIYSPVVMGNFN